MMFNIRLFTLLFCLSWSFNTFSEDCIVQFPDGLQNSDSTGSIKFNWQAKLINSPDNILDTQDLQDGSGGVSCDTTVCTLSNNLVPKIDFADFTGGSDVNVGFAETLTISPGNYDNLTMSSQANLLLEPGIYTFDKQVNIGSESTIELTEPGTVQFYVNNQVNFNNQTVINSQAGNHYFGLYANKNITLVSSMSFHGIIYGQGNITVQSNASVVGAIAGEKQIELISGATVTFDPTVLDGEYGEICTPSVPDLIAEYRFEESSWDGSVDQVLDESVNSLHGRTISVNGRHPTLEDTDPAIPESSGVGTCRYGLFERNDGYVRIEDDPLLDLDEELSVTLWMQPNSFPFGGNLQTLASKDENWEFHTNRSREINWWWGGGTRELTTSGASLQTGQWHHVAIVFGESRQSIYVDGVERAFRTDGGSLTTNSDPVLIGVDLNFNSRRFNGLIDEVRIYSGALTATQVNSVRLETHPCSSGPDHYAIAHAGTSVTCEPATVTIQAHDASDNAVPAGNGNQITLGTTATNMGWNLISGNGTWDGINKYTFTDDVEGTVVFALAKTEAGSINIDVEDTNGITDRRNSADPEDRDLIFSDAAFSFISDGTVNNIGTHISAKPSSQTHLLRFTESDPDTGECVSNTAGALTVNFAYECDNPTTCVLSNGVDISGTSVSGNDQGNVVNYSPVTLNFANGEAPFTLNYLDAGRIRLHAQADVPVINGTADVSGSSNYFVVRPAGLCVQAQTANNDCSSGDASCSVFVKAGESFNLKVSAHRWVSDFETNTDFCDNTITQNFSSSFAMAPNLVAPSGGVNASLGALSGFISSGVSDGGEDTLSQTVSEVGVFTIQTNQIDDYLGQADADIPVSVSDNIGRFIPDHFSLSGSVVEACSGRGYDYLSEPFSTDVTLTAKNVGLVTTENYIDDFAKYQTTADATAMTGGALSGLLSGNEDLTARLTIGLNRLEDTWASGVGTLPIDLNIGRENLPDGPFLSTEVGLLASDSDGVTLRSSDLDLDPDGNTVNNFKKLTGSTDQFFGRLIIQSAHGPETENLTVPMFVERYESGNFILADTDSCTGIALNQFRFDSVAIDETLAGRTVDLAGGTTVGMFGVMQPDSGGVFNQFMINGDAGFFFTAPGTGITDNTVLIDVDLTSYPWLLDDWDRDGNYDNQTLLPAVTAQFVRYRGHDRIIYWRERF